ncbi:MAG: endoglucanase, partial [Chloroflexota bacterium]|nr:endoglucanase [Chloroflexota bacterium]
QYVSAWRHVAAVFRQEGAMNARWVWCPNVGGSATAAYRPFYPGDAYVGWVGMDGYNWGTTQRWSHWQELATVFGSAYHALIALTARPMMIGERASAE